MGEIADMKLQFMSAKTLRCFGIAWEWGKNAASDRIIIQFWKWTWHFEFNVDKKKS